MGDTNTNTNFKLVSRGRELPETATVRPTEMDLIPTSELQLTTLRQDEAPKHRHNAWRLGHANGSCLGRLRRDLVLHLGLAPLEANGRRTTANVVGNLDARLGGARRR
ncbi:hypothetical protein CMUS01_09785 [Colletotrichum musicola]|uniref:Uncharacterized protein n=1 Tax=Colletotrichum musicola TaxID=2175873 RepID=A0A8H6K6X7_9PEZI|nr:hypothetical protein CMUS01_09785 [Colletotrichum musicola]